MRIVIGWYSFKIKSYHPNELGINNSEFQNSTIEVRQRCFHVFFIPVFGFGKIYSYRKEGKLYDLPEEIIGKAKNLKTVKTPFYTFSFPIILILFGLGYFLSQELTSIKGKNVQEQEYTQILNQFKNEINHLTTDHYIKIRDFNRYSETEDLYLKVEEINGNNLKLLVCKPNLELDKALPFVFYLGKNYIENKAFIDSVLISKTNLLKAICKDYLSFYDHTFYNQNEEGIEFFNDSNRYIIESIEYLKGPVLRVENTGRVNQIEVKNYGNEVNLVEIENQENIIFCSEKLPLLISSPGSFTLEVKNYSDELSYKGVLIFEDSHKKRYRFSINGNNFEKKIKRLVE